MSNWRWIAAVAGLLLIAIWAGLTSGDGEPTEQPPIVPFASEHEKLHDKLASGSRVEVQYHPPSEARKQSKGPVVETLGPMTEESQVRLTEFLREGMKAYREKEEKALRQLENPELDAVTALKLSQAYYTALAKILRDQIACRLIATGDYYTHNGTFPEHLFQPPEFTWIGISGLYRLQNGKTANDVFLPIRFADHEELNNLEKRLLRLNADHASELCRDFNSKTFPERKRAYDKHQAARKRLRELHLTKPRTDEVRQEIRAARLSLLPVTIRVKGDHLIASVRKHILEAAK